MTLRASLKIIPIIAGLVMTAPQSAAASKKNVEELKKTIVKEQKQQAKIKANLKQEDMAVNTLNKKLRNTSNKLKKQNKEVKKLSEETQSLHQAMVEQSNHIKLHLSSAYKLKQHPMLRVVLDHQNPNTRRRHLHYIEKLNIDNAKAIAAMQQTIAQLEKAEQQMKSYQHALEATKKRQNQERKQLQKTKQQRERKLKAISASIASKQKQLDQMKKDNRALEHVVAKVKVNKPSSKQPKAFQSHSIPKPCQGKISQHFGQSIHNSELKTQGIVIDGDDNDPIYVVADGHVVYADWLSGFGLLLIVDHHNGYLSLYGRNDSLEVEVGDELHQGDKIASMGKSGSFEKTGLYFAIRKGDRSIDPEPILEKS